MKSMRASCTALLSPLLVLAALSSGCGGAPPRDDTPERVSALERENGELRRRVDALEREVQDLILSADQSKAFLPTEGKKRIDTTVTEVKGGGEVVLGAGTDAGLHAGMQVTIYRATQFVAKVEVVRSDAGRAVAKVLFTSPGQKIVAGDLAATRLD